MAHARTLTVSDFPGDFIDRSIVDVGRVSRIGVGSTEPLWEIKLRRLQRPNEITQRSAPNEYTAQIGARIFYALALASIWNGRDLQNRNGPYISEGILFNADDQRIVWRTNSNPVIVCTERVPDAIPCVEVPLSGHPIAEFAHVRCSEIIRFYFCELPSLSQFLFDFSDGTRINEKLFVQRHTKVEDDLVTIKPTSTISNDKHANFVGGLLGHQPSARSLAHIAHSARAANVAGEPVRPTALLPLEGVTKWDVLGVPRYAEIRTKSASFTHVPTLMISNIRTCFSEIDYPDVTIIRDAETKKPPTERVRDIPSLGGIIRENVKITSEEPPGARVTFEEETFLSSISARPNIVRPRPKVIHRKGKNDPRDAIHVAEATQIIQEVSALGGSGGPSNIGMIDAPPSGPSPDHVFEDESAEPEDRSSLPSLFSNSGIALPRVEHTPWIDVPDAFQPFLRAGNLLVAEHAIAKNVTFCGKAISMEDDTIPLLRLPDEWGDEMYCDASPTGFRRILSMAIAIDDFQLLLLNIERRESEIGRLGPCAFFVRGQFSPFAISNAIHSRLVSKSGWPDRSTHAGDFWSRRLKHPRNSSRSTHKAAQKIEEAVTICAYRAKQPHLRFA